MPAFALSAVRADA